MSKTLNFDEKQLVRRFIKGWEMREQNRQSDKERLVKARVIPY